MAQFVLLRGAKQVLTLQGSGVRRGPFLQDIGLIEDGSVLICDGKIASVGMTRRLENLKQARDALEIPVHGAVVMPGFFDPCMRLSLVAPAAPRSRLKRKKMADFYSETLTLMRSCLQHGTLNAEIKAMSGTGVISTDLAVFRQLTRLGNNPVGVSRAWHINVPGERSIPVTMLESLTVVRKQKLAQALELAAHASPSALAADNFQRLCAAAAKAGLEVNLMWGRGAVEDLKSLLALTRPRAVFCHPDLSAEECAVLAGSPSIATFKAGREVIEEPPANGLHTLAEAGGAIALASGYDAREEPNFNMQLVLALAVMRLKLTVEQAIVAATINAAYAAGCGDETGSITVGKRADLLVLDLADYRELPRRFGVNHVGIAIREGTVAFNRVRRKAAAP